MPLLDVDRTPLRASMCVRDVNVVDLEKSHDAGYHLGWGPRRLAASRDRAPTSGSALPGVASITVASLWILRRPLGDLNPVVQHRHHVRHSHHDAHLIFESKGTSRRKFPRLPNERHRLEVSQDPSLPSARRSTFGRAQARPFPAAAAHRRRNSGRERRRGPSARRSAEFNASSWPSFSLRRVWGE